MKFPKENPKIYKKSLIVILSLGLLLIPLPGRVAAESPVAIIGNSKNVVKLEVAQTPDQIHRGLMFRTSLPDNAGMVFLFNPPESTRFWMYHTLIPLDLIFIRGGTILKLCESVPPCKSENPADCPEYPIDGSITVTEVVEVNGGYCKQHGIKEGDTIKFASDGTKSLSSQPAVRK